jgi:hypothetical protein
VRKKWQGYPRIMDAMGSRVDQVGSRNQVGSGMRNMIGEHDWEI